MGAEKPLILRSEYARWREALPDDYPTVADYRRVVLRWVVGAEGAWTTDDAHPKLGTCRMKSRHTHVCTARALPVYAALAADAGLKHPAWTRAKLAERLNAAIAFLCATYDPNKPGKGKWTKQPQRNSLRYETWVIGNMLDVVQIVPGLVSPENRRRIREILIDIVEDERTSGRARSLKDYRHEGITWTINLLARGALLYPDHPKASEWLDLARHGYASALSVEADREDETVVDGKPVKEWVARRCPVFYPDFTFTHHGLGIHPGYMGFAAHRVVSLYDLLERSGQPVSAVWLHHYRDVTDVMKALALWDGRVAYPNGKDWADYLYGVSSVRFHMAGRQMMFGDGEARLIEQGLFRQLEWLQRQRGRGDFGPSNAEYVHNVNDAKNVAFTYWLHQAHGFAPPATQAQLDKANTRVFHSPHSRFVCVRDPARFASWGWQAMKGRSTGLILPSGHGLGDHLAQWDDSLCPDYWTLDKAGRRRPLQPGRRTRQVETFAGGFAVSERTELHLAAPRKGAETPIAVLDHRAMVALPDGRTVVFAATGRAVRAVKQLATTDINWRFVRSVFSDNKRTILHDGGQTECADVKNLRTSWLNVEDVLGIVPIGEPARVSCQLFDAHPGQTVRLGVASLAPRDYEPGQDIFAAAVAFMTDADAAQTKRLVGACRAEEPGRAIRICRVRGQDGKGYVVAVNGSDAEAEVTLAGAGASRLLTPKAARLAREAGQRLRLTLAARACAVLTQ